MDTEIKSMIQKYADDVTKEFHTRLYAAIGLDEIETGPTKGAADVRKPNQAVRTLLAAGHPKKSTRKKPPIQFCPVPGCKNRAAPVFGMVCADHRKVSKAKIKKYREERRAKAAKK